MPNLITLHMMPLITLITFSQTKSGTDRLRQLYTDVQRRGPKAYARLVDALLQSGNAPAAREDEFGSRSFILSSILKINVRVILISSEP